MKELSVSDLKDLCLASLDATIKQGVRSEDDSGACLYRGPNGIKCPIGHLIADEHYSSELEGKHLSSIAVIDALSASLCAEITPEDRHVLLRLQAVHDTLEKEDWIEIREELMQRPPNTKGELAICLESGFNSVGDIEVAIRAVLPPSSEVSMWEFYDPREKELEAKIEGVCTNHWDRKYTALLRIADDFSAGPFRHFLRRVTENALKRAG